MEITMFNGKIHYKWSFSIAMLVHQRVPIIKPPWNEANICNEAAIFAARRSAETVEMQDFERVPCEKSQRSFAG